MCNVWINLLRNLGLKSNPTLVYSKYLSRSTNLQFCAAGEGWCDLCTWHSYIPLSRFCRYFIWKACTLEKWNFFNDVSFGSCTFFPSCGFCPNRTLLYFPLYPRPSVCEILHFSNVKWHICHMNHQRTQETPDILKPNNFGYLSRPDSSTLNKLDQITHMRPEANFSTKIGKNSV